MKKVILLAIIMVSFTTVAQRGEERGHRGDFKDMTAEQIATLQTKKMTLALDLTETQQNRIQALNLEQAKKRKAKMQERKAQKESGEKKELSSDERFALKMERLDAAIAHKAELKKILSEEQYGKWETMMHKKRKHRKGKHSKSKNGRK